MKKRKNKSILTYFVISAIGATLLISAISPPGFSHATATNSAPSKAVKVPQQAQANAQSSTLSGSAFLYQNAPSRTIKVDKSGAATITNPDSTVVIANKKRMLPASYAPKDLTVPNVAFSFSGYSPKKQMRKPAANALEKMFAAAKKDGIELKAVSGYRSYATQKSIFQRNAEQKGEEVANRTSAKPGQSEHQSGLAMDVSSASVNYTLETDFGQTKEGKWLKKNASKYGFIIRYEDGKEKITGYTYEPWHVRYVGVWIAGEIARQGLTLEQYMKTFE